MSRLRRKNRTHGVDFSRPSFDVFIQGLVGPAAAFKTQIFQRSMVMKFLCIYKPSKPEGTPPTQEEMVKMGQLIE